jgi:hypothetical protein
MTLFNELPKLNTNEDMSGSILLTAIEAIELKVD